MINDCISYQKSGYFTKLITDYLDQKETLNPFYNRFPTIYNFEAQIAEKRISYNNNIRLKLVNVLMKQYQNIDLSLKTKLNIESLADENTFTVTTGHQLNLFTGPVYFLYKIVTTIKLSQELKNAYPDFNFVPIYWMATEDHDFEEINYFSIHGKKFRWNKPDAGAVGALDTEGLEAVYSLFEQEIGSGIFATELKNLFRKCYLEKRTLAEATRIIANELFSDYGLVILDASERELKKECIPFFTSELINQDSHKIVSETIDAMHPYTIQVNPREINLFYLLPNARERIIFENEIYKINNTSIQFSTEELLKELELHPEKFSPNVILRPLYQELILPNLAYIGGGGELAYWFELKAFFDHAKVTFPMLVLRNSAVVVSEKQINKANKLGLSINDLFEKQNNLVNKKTVELSEFPIDFSKQKQILAHQFEYLYLLASKTDKSFLGAVKAQEKKQQNGLLYLEKRLLKAQKKKYEDQTNIMIELQNEIFPLRGLQERHVNFSEFYLIKGNSFIEHLFEKFAPLEQNFSLILL